MHENLRDKEAQSESDIHALLTVKSFCRKHDWPEGGLRHLIFHKPDGFENCIRRVGRKILISEREFFRWVDSINRVNSKARGR